jgi:dTDP-4-dehydrorhamnose reductase
MNIRLLITGAKGQLGNEFRVLAKEHPEMKFTFTDVDDLDITDFQALELFFQDNSFDVILNCAAYTAVDKAEEDTVNATMINVVAPRYLAQFAGRQNAKLIHFSTDYVYGGKSYRPYTEEDETHPASFYARTKLDGEKEVMLHAPDYMIIRTSWLYSSFGNNFVRTMLRKGAELGQLRVVFDQVGTPTYAADLASAILTVLPLSIEKRIGGIFQFANEGVCSWYDFALASLEIAGIPCKVIPIETKEYPLPAERPYYSVLNKSKFKQAFGIEIPYWRDSLLICVKKLMTINN